MSEHSYISSESASCITLVSVSGLLDAQAAGWALTLSQAQMPGCKALLCSPVRPADLPASVDHLVIAPLDYQGYSWFMLFMLWRVVHTDFALVVQDDGWVLEGRLWRDEYLSYDYIGAPIHLARVEGPEGSYWSRGFAWVNQLPEGHQATAVQNGGFSLRSRRLMRVFEDNPQLKIEVGRPDFVTQEPLKMHWVNDGLNEDVQISGVLRPVLEQSGMRFAPVEIAATFAIEHAAQFHQGLDAMRIFGHHAKLRKLHSLQPLTVRYPINRAQVQQLFGEPELAAMLERRSYSVEYAEDQA